MGSVFFMGRAQCVEPEPPGRVIPNGDQ